MFDEIKIEEQNKAVGFEQLVSPPASLITNEDCIEMMKRYPDKFFELAVVDPPYGIGDFEQGIGKQKKVKKWEIKWNEKTPDQNYFNELRRVSKNQIIWGANYYNCFDGGKGAIVWVKNITHPDMSKAEIASVSHYKKVEIINLEWNGFIRCENEGSIHPCQKPVALYEWIFVNYAKKGDKILDTHLGSGSSRIAAWKTKFDFYGCELDKNYYEAQEDRFKKFVAQLTLW